MPSARVKTAMPGMSSYSQGTSRPPQEQRGRSGAPSPTWPHAFMEQLWSLVVLRLLGPSQGAERAPQVLETKSCAGPSSQPVFDALGQKRRTRRGVHSLAMGFVISRRELFSVWHCLQCICSSCAPSNGKNRWLFNSSGTESCWPCCLRVPSSLQSCPRREGTQTGGWFIPNSFPSPSSMRLEGCWARWVPHMRLRGVRASQLWRDSAVLCWS